MGMIAKPVANIPLTAPGAPGMLRALKGCRFEPAVWLSRGKMYLIVVTANDPRTYRTIPGFYDVPDKGKVVFIKTFTLLQISAMSVARTWAIVYEAMEGDPPLDWTPDKQFDYRQYKIEEVVAEREKRVQVNAI